MAQSGILTLGVSGVGVYFLLEYWLKSKYENRGALQQVLAVHLCRAVLAVASTVAMFGFRPSRSLLGSEGNG